MLAAVGVAAEDSLSQSDAFVAFLLANGHFLLEVLLFGAIVFLLLQRSYKPDKKPLTERVRAEQPRARARNLAVVPACTVCARGKRRRGCACGCSCCQDSPRTSCVSRRRSTRCARSGSLSRLSRR